MIRRLLTFGRVGIRLRSLYSVWTDPRRALIVLESVRLDQKKLNPYITLLVESLREHADVRSFSWGRAIFGRYDIFHLHWPEGLYHSPSAGIRGVKILLTMLLIMRSILLTTTIIQTIHNASPHVVESKIENCLRRYLDNRTTAWIAMNRHTTPATDRQTALIPHGHYAEWYGPDDGTPIDPGRVLSFGIIRRYKNLASLVDAFGEQSRGRRLRIVGFPADEEHAGGLNRRALGIDGVELDLRHLGDDELASEIRAAELVVLPYEEFHNSGSVLLALTLGRPTLVPRNPVTEDLADEVGRDWVLLFDHPLKAEDLERALETVGHRDPESSPALGGRDWDSIGARTFEWMIHAKRSAV